MEQATDGERPGIDKRFDFFVGCCDYFRYLPDLEQNIRIYIYIFNYKLEKKWLDRGVMNTITKFQIGNVHQLMDGLLPFGKNN